MLMQSAVVFLLDVDNTLLDNDRFAAELSARLDHDFGKPECNRYWTIYASLRERFGYADYLGALQAFRVCGNDEPALLGMSAFLLDYPFAERVYPQALAALAHLDTLGTTAIVSDGDIVFQPRKVQRSGIWAAVAGRVLITLHKERRLDLIQRRFPARHYVMIDDKPPLLAAMKRVLGDRLRTVLVRQGHYASVSLATDPAPDLTIEHIADLCAFELTDFGIAGAAPVAGRLRLQSTPSAVLEQP